MGESVYIKYLPCRADGAGMVRAGILVVSALVLGFGGAFARAHVQSMESHAHEPGVTYTALGLHADGVEVLYTVPREDVDRLAAGRTSSAELREVVTAGFRLTDGDEPCRLEGIGSEDYSAIDAYQFELSYRCPSMNSLTIEYGLFVDEAHVNHLEIWLAGNVFSTALQANRRSIDVPVAHVLWERGWRLPAEPPELPGRKPSLWQYLELGFDHVVTGYDHLAFVLGLVLLVQRFRHLVGLVTSFTLAHSITLGLAALDVFVLPGSTTEILIALSIVYVGLENLWSLRMGAGRPGAALGRFALGRRWATSFGFGLVHGFGFSFLLREVGLPPESLVMSLALFNIGVELAQLAVVVVPFLVLQVLLRGRPAFRIAASVLAVAITSVGLLWLIERWA